MAFVNEYVSEEDIQKYQLDEIMEIYFHDIFKEKQQWNATERKALEKKLKLEHYYNWTHDKDLNSWLKKERSIPVYQESSGIWAGSTTYEFLFYWNNAVYRLILQMMFDTVEVDKTGINKIYNTSWEFQSMTTLEGKPVEPTEEFLKDLAAAIKVYGRSGITQIAKNGRVELIIKNSKGE